jgi:hypothetical protein
MIRARIRSVLAAALVLVQALAPFAHLPARATASGWLDVCTSEGLRRVRADDSPAAPLHGDEHCVLCQMAQPLCGAALFASAMSRAQPANTPVLPAQPLFASGPLPHDGPARAPPAVA